MSSYNDTYSEQAYLLWAFLTDPIAFKKEAPARSYVKDIIGTYEPQNVMSRIASKKNAKRKGTKKANTLFFSLANHKLSALVPELRLFRADPDGTSRPFYFPVTTVFEGLAEGGGADLTSNANGIQRFSVRYQGTDLYTSSRYLSCELTLYVDSLKNILKEPPKGFARLADLFALRMSGKNISQFGYSAGQGPQSIEIVATLGYSIIDRDIFTDEEITAIRDTFQIVRMNVSDHTINLNQDGTATIDISYTARLESAGGNSDNKKFFSVTASPEDIVDTSEMLTFIEEVKQLNKPKPKSKTKTPQQKPKSFTTKEERYAQLKQVFYELEVIDGFGEVNFNKQTYNSYLNFVNGTTNPAASGVPALNLSPKPPFSTTGTTKDKLQALEDEIVKFSNGEDPIPFVYYGDLIECFFLKCQHTMEQAFFELDQKVKDKKLQDPFIKEINKRLEKLKKFKILLPKIVLKFQDINSEIGLSYLPLSMPVVTSFLYKTYYNRSDVLNYTIDYFLKQLDELHVRIFKDPAVSKILDGDHVLKKVNYSGAKLRLTSKTRIKIDDLFGPGADASPQDDQEYYVIYQENNQSGPSPGLLGTRKSDEDKGIYHFVPGQDRGLIKSINFTKFDVPYKRESLMVEQTNLYDELMMPYSANVTMFGNNLFLPGSQIYIDPYSIGFGDPQDQNSAAFRLGFGGYYTILSVNTEFAPGTMETSLECSFGSFPAGSRQITTITKNPVTESQGIDKALAADNSPSQDNESTKLPPPSTEIT